MASPANNSSPSTSHVASMKAFVESAVAKKKASEGYLKGAVLFVPFSTTRKEIEELEAQGATIEKEEPRATSIVKKDEGVIQKLTQLASAIYGWINKGR